MIMTARLLQMLSFLINKTSVQIPVYLSDSLKTLDLPVFPQVCYHKKLRFPLFLPLWGKTRETVYQLPPTTLSSRRAEERFASLVE